LITGAGLIGTHTAKTLLDQGVGVVLYDPEPSLRYIESVVGPDRKLFRVERGDVRDLPRLIDLALRVGVTRILHTAGLVGPAAEESPSLSFQVNVAGTLNLIELARIRSLARIVFVSSSFVYFDADPPPGDQPIPEELPYRVPSSFYAAYKAAAEMVALAYHRLSGVNAIICRPCGVYGRGGFVGGARAGRVLQDRLLQAIAEPGAEIAVDLPVAERVYVKDAALAIREAIFVEKPSTRIYNVGSGEVVTSEALAAAVNAAIPGARVLPGQAETGLAARLIDSSAAVRDLGYHVQWPLERAIADYVAELRAHGGFVP
jgi:nucleoside-diphosphate-sugar epimerase